MSNGGVAKPSERGEKRGIKRDRKTMNRLKMYNARPIRDRKGKVVYEQFQVCTLSGNLLKFASQRTQATKLVLSRTESGLDLCEL